MESLYMPKNVIRNLYQLNDDTSGAVMIYLRRSPTVQNRRLGEFTGSSRATAGFKLMDYQPVRVLAENSKSFPARTGPGRRLDLSLWEDEVDYMKWSVGALDYGVVSSSWRF